MHRCDIDRTGLRGSLRELQVRRSQPSRSLHMFAGGEVIQGFTFGMIWGVIVGTYSSVFVASVVLKRLGVKRDWSKPDTEGPAGVQFGSTDAP